MAKCNKIETGYADIIRQWFAVLMYRQGWKWPRSKGSPGCENCVTFYVLDIGILGDYQICDCTQLQLHNVYGTLSSDTLFTGSMNFNNLVNIVWSMF